MIKINAQPEAIAHHAETSLSVLQLAVTGNALKEGVLHSHYYKPGHLVFDWLPLGEIGLSVLIQLLVAATIKVLRPKTSAFTCLLIGDIASEIFLAAMMMHH
jgi:hypothetical protein